MAAGDTSDTPTREKDVVVPDVPYKTDIVWQNVAKFIVLHCFSLYGLILLPQLSWRTWLFLVLCHCWGLLGITAGAHRLWSHRTYKVSRLVIQFFPDPFFLRRSYLCVCF